MRSCHRRKTDVLMLACVFCYEEEISGLMCCGCLMGDLVDGSLGLEDATGSWVGNWEDGDGCWREATIIDDLMSRLPFLIVTVVVMPRYIPESKYIFYIQFKDATRTQSRHDQSQPNTYLYDTPRLHTIVPQHPRQPNMPTTHKPLYTLDIHIHPCFSSNPSLCRTPFLHHTALQI